MEQCFVKRCQNIGTEYRDRTITGIGDFRYYCKDHVKEADARAAVADAEMSLSYAKSLVDKAIADYKAASDKVVEAQKRLLAARLAISESA